MPRGAPQRLVDAMDPRVPPDGARVSRFRHGGGPDETRWVAHERGHRRCGITLIRLALRSPDVPAVAAGPPARDDIRHADPEIRIDWFTGAEPESRTPHASSPRSDKVMVMTTPLALIGTIVMAVVGVVAAVVTSSAESGAAHA